MPVYKEQLKENIKKGHGIYPTLGELDDALAKASKATSGVYIEIIVDKWEIAKGCEFFFTATGAYFGQTNRTWAGWLKELAKKSNA